MMLLNQRFVAPVKFILILCTLIRYSYQQQKDLKFCIKNHSMSSTLQTFWHDANSLCELEAKTLIDLYRKLLEATPAQEDQCSALLKHQVRKKVIQLISTKLGEAFVMKSLQNNRELKETLSRLQQMDSKVAQVIWEIVMNEVFLFVQPEEIINEILQLNGLQQKIIAFQSLLNKYLNSNLQTSDSLLPHLTCRIYSLIENEISSVIYLKRLNRLYHRLPKELRLLCESSNQTIGLLNYRYFEYLYAPRENGPDADRRIPLTWSKSRNSTDSDGHLSATFDDSGLAALGSRFGSALKYIYADREHQAAYFWIGSGLKSARWWRILWPHASYHPGADGYVLLENEETKELLCATHKYDEDRRYVMLLNSKRNLENAACFWLVTEL